MAEELGTIVVDPMLKKQKEDMVALKEGVAKQNAMFSDLLGKLAFLGQPSATSEQIDAVNRQGIEAAKPRKSSTSDNKTSNGGIPSPADDPEGFTRAAMLTAIMPLIVQHGAEHYQQTGQVPDPKIVLGNILPKTDPSMPPDNSAQAGMNPNFIVNQPKGAWQSLFGRPQVAQDATTGQISYTPGGALGGYDQNTAALQQAAAIQALSGRTPMQMGEAQKAELEVATDVAKAKRVPPTQMQQKELEAGYSKQLTEQRDKSIQRLDDTIKQTMEYRQQIYDKSNFLGKRERLAAIDEQLKKLQEIRAQHLQNNFDRELPGNRTTRKRPSSGTVEGGYRFKGGDPANKANWEKV